jgi:hypothetical protein
MRDVFYGLAALACPVGMGAMMWVMGKGMRKGLGKADPNVMPSVETLREEHRRLGQQIDRIESGDSEGLTPAQR